MKRITGQVELGRPHRCRADRGAARRSGGARLQRLLLLGRPDPHWPGRHPGPALGGVPVRRPRRPRHARRVSGRRRDHPARAAAVVPTGDQPDRAATAGVAGAAAGTARDSGLAARAAGSADLRAVHPDGCAGLRVVGRRVELAADAGGAGVGVRGRCSTGAHRQSALRRDGSAGIRRRPAVLRKGGRHPVRRVRGRRAAGLCHRHGFTDDGVAPRDSAVGRVAGGDGRVDRRLPRGRRPEALEPGLVDDVGSAGPVGDTRHRARTRWWAVGLATLGARLAVGDAAADRHDSGLGGAGGGDRTDPHPQTAHRRGVARRASATRWRARSRST